MSGWLNAKLHRGMTVFSTKVKIIFDLNNIFRNTSIQIFEIEINRSVTSKNEKISKYFIRKWFEPKSKMIIWVTGVLRRTVVGN